MTASSPSIASELADAVTDILVRAQAAESFTSTQSTDRWSTKIWAALSESGLLQAMVDEEHGGLGLGFDTIETAIARVGAEFVSGPVAEHLAVTPLVAALPGSTPLLGAQSEDEFCIAVVDSSMSETPASSLRIIDGSLTGTVPLVRFADIASVLVVLVEDESGRDTLAVVSPSNPNVLVAPSASFDPLVRYATVTFNRATPTTLLATGAEAISAIKEIRSRLRLAAACEASGTCRRLLEMSVNYAKGREQFGVPIGSFQAVQHLLADMAAQVEMLESICAAATKGATDSASASPHDLAAKALAAKIGRQVAETALQVHGGIGFTLEHPVHFGVQHLLGLQGFYGDEKSLARRLGRRLLEVNPAG